MELFIAIGMQYSLAAWINSNFMSDRIPNWVQKINRDNSTLWNFGIVAMKTTKVIIYLARR